LSQAFVKEMEKGRTTTTPYGEVVHLDIRHLGEKLIDAKLPFVRELCRKYENLDPVREMIPVRPVVHYMMGGVHTDLEGATPLPGLYAAGEVACVSINGSNRLGSNSLTELLVFGARAGRAAARYAAATPPATPDTLALAYAEERRLDTLRRACGGERVAVLRTEMQQALERGAGIYRDEAGLGATAAKIAELRERSGGIWLDDRSLTFNTELLSFLELANMLEVAEAIIHSGRERRESRGAHQRTDHPGRDDERFLAHSLAYRQEGAAPRIAYQPVTITRWPPGERIYGR
jgi:fumarate reductase flavoprotein subunit